MVQAAMSAQAASSSNVSEACAKAAELSSRGTAALHRLMNTVSSLLAVGSGSGERPALGARIDPELLKLSVAERTTKLYGDYVQCSRELQEVVTECAAHGTPSPHSLPLLQALTFIYALCLIQL